MINKLLQMGSKLSWTGTLLGLLIIVSAGNVAATPIAITTSSMPSGMEGMVYSASLDATDGTAPYAWSVKPQIVAWGYNGYGQCTVPAGLSDVETIATGGLANHDMALKYDGTVVAWGRNDYGQTNVPAGLSNVVAIAVGNSHSMALKSNGSVVAWGSNDHGESNVPAGALSDVVAIAAGYWHSLALKSDGTVVVWGDNSRGQGTVPTGLSNVQAIAAGAIHNLALKTDGTVVAWGQVNEGQCNVPAGLTNVVAVAAGFYYSLALKSDGTVVHWGDNSMGRLVVPTGLSNVTGVAAGSYHALALKSDGAVVAWGFGPNGQTNVPAGLANVVAVSAGASHSLALLSGLPEGLSLSAEGVVSGTPATEGTNWVEFVVQDSLGATTNKVLAIVIGPPVPSAPVPCVALDVTSTGFSANWSAAARTTNYFLDVSTVETFASYVTGFSNLRVGNVTNISVTGLSPGNTYYYRLRAQNSSGISANSGAIAVTLKRAQTINFPAIGSKFTADVVELWATASSGLAVSFSVRSGPATITGGTTLTFTGPGEVRIVASQAGNNNWDPAPDATNTFSIMRTAGELVAWGNNENGQCNIPAGLTNVAEISACGYHNLVLKFDGTVVAWGQNDNGECNVPAGLTDVVAVAGGTSHSLALKSDGTVMAWGNNGWGQTNVPSGLSNVDAIVSGWYHNLALRSDGTVAAWGNDSYGSCTPPAGLTNATAVAAGASYSLALKSDGTVVAWGGTIYGPYTVPAGLTNVTAIAAGAKHSLALRSNGTVTAWGDNGNRQCDVPAGLSNVVALAAGWYTSFALCSDGSVVAWGTNVWNVCDVPGDLTDAVSLSSGWYHALALVGGKAVQTIAFPAIGNKLPTDTVELAAEASSGLPVGFAVVSGPGSLEGTTLTFTGEGQVLIKASQEGDDNWNPAPSRFMVTVVDTTGPALTVPADLTAEATGAEGAGVSFASPTATDLVDPNPTVSVDHASNSVFPIGETVVTATATDASSNTSSASFTVTVADTTPPTITVPSDIVVEATNPSGRTVTFNVPTAVDLVDPHPTLSLNHASGSVFPLGATIVTATATDVASNTATASFTVTVVDTAVPVITVPANIVAEATGPSGAAVTFGASTATDLADPDPTVSVNPASGSVFPLGATLVTATAWDASGNTNTSQFTVTVVDTTPPVITVPSNLVAEAAGSTGAAVSFTAPTAMDLVDAHPTVNLTHTSGSVFAIGTTVVTATAWDVSGNTNTSQFTVTVVDTTAPAITVPSNLVAEATGPAGAAVTFVASTAVDAIDANPTVIVDHASGSVFAIGETVVTATAWDASGNTNTSQFTVTVEDTTPPTISVQANVLVEATGPEGAPAEFSASAADLVDPAPGISLDHVSGNVYPLGETVVTVTATDASGNASTASFLVTVVDMTDSEGAYSGGSGTLAHPYRISKVADWMEFMAATNDWGKHFILTTNLYFGGMELTPVGSFVADLNLLDQYSFTGTFDGHGHVLRNAAINQPSLSFVGVFGCIHDTEIRNLGLENISVMAGNYVGGLVGFLCGGTITNCYVTGSVRGGNTVGGLVGEVETSGPIKIVNCYASCSVAANYNAGGLIGFLNGGGTVTGCYTTGSISANYAAGGLMGKTWRAMAVDCYATGPVSASNICAGGLVGVMQIGSTISNCYAVGPVSGSNTVGGLVGEQDMTNNLIISSYSIGAVSGTANVGGLVGAQDAGNMVTGSYWDKDTSGQISSVGGGEGRTTDEMTHPYAANTYVGWNFAASWTEDSDYRNNGYPYFDWQVFGPSAIHPLVITVPWIPPMEEATGPDGAAVWFDAPTAASFVDPAPEVSWNYASGSIFPMGETVVTVTATDASNNTAVTNFTVTVVDTTAPTITVPSNIVIEATGPGTAVAFAAPTATDLVDPDPAMSWDHASGSLFAPGVTVVTATATDFSGNTATASFTVTVYPGSTVVAWGSNWDGQTNVPAGLVDAVAISTLHSHSLALRADGTVWAWGDNDYGQANVPAGLSNVVGIAAGFRHNLALKSDGTVVAWGTNDSGDCNVPSTLSNVVAVAAGIAHSLALRADGTMAVWGETGYFACNMPPGLSNVVAISAGSHHNLALRSDGTVVAWGYNDNGQRNVPAGLSNVVAIAAGDSHSMALRSDGTIVAWGGNGSGQCTVPAGLSNAVAIAAGYNNSLALKSDGTVVAWGNNTYGQCGVPGGMTNVTAIEAGMYHALAIVGRPTDIHPPMITMPADIVMEEAGPGMGAAVAFFVRVADLLDPHPALTLSPDSGSVFPLGATEVTATATDASGNTATASFTVTVVADVTAPSITVPSNIVTEATGPDGATVAFAAPTAIDLGDPNPVVSVEPASGSVFPIGETVVTATAWDASGNTNTSQFTVTVVDTTAPVITGLSNLVAEATGPDGATVTFSAPTVTDLVDPNPAVSVNPASDNVFPLGTTVVTATATDASGNIKTNQFTITVVDTTAPILTVPENIVVDATWAVGAAVAFDPPTATDVVDPNPVVYLNHASGGVFPIGETRVTVTATDTSSNTATANFTVTVSKGNALANTVVAWGRNYSDQCNVPSNLTNAVAISMGDYHSLALKSDGTVVAWGSNARGECTVPAGLSNVVDIAAGEYYSLALQSDGTLIPWGMCRSSGAEVPMYVPAGLTNVTAIEAFGANAVALRSNGTVVTWGWYSYPPPADLTNAMKISAGGYHGLALRSDGTVTAWGSYVGLHGWMTAYVPAGLSNVMAIAAGAAHSLALRSDGTVVAWGTNDNGQCDVPVDLTNAVDVAAGYFTSYALRSDGTVVAWGYNSEGQANVPPGLTNVTAIAAGLFNVAVVGSGDTTEPTIIVPSNIIAEATGPEGAAVSFAAPTAVDTADPNPTVSVDPASGSMFPVGETVVTITAMDAASNTATASFTVTVVDTTAPVLTVPENIVAEATTPAGAAVSFAASTAADLVDPNPTVSVDPASGSVFPVGETVVTVTAMDAASNPATASFTVTVVDTTAPEIPGSSNLVAEATGPDGAAVTFTTPAATDLVDSNPAVSMNPASGSLFPLGETVVTVTATDASSNSATASFTVTVVDTTAPEIPGSSNLVAEATGPDGATVTFAAPAATDLVDSNPAVSMNPVSSSVFALGETVVTVTATDASSNSVTASFTVTVVDTTAPEIPGSSNLVAEATGPDGAAVTFAAPAATDLADLNPAVSMNPASGSVFALGETVVTVTATDSSSNSATASFTVTVVDTTAPVLTVPENIVAEATSPDGAAVQFSVSAVDLADSTPTITLDHAAGSVFALGETLVTVTVTDVSSNTTTTNFTVTVVDTLPPVITLAGNNPETIALGDLYTDAGATAVDDYAGPVVVTVSGAVNSDVVGNYALVYNANDGRGHSAEATRIVQVVDGTASATGNVVWVRQFGSASSDYGWGIAADSGGNSYVAGMLYWSTPGMDPAVGPGDVFVRKYDPDGNEIWAREFGSVASDYALTIAIDATGNNYVAGYTYGALPGQTHLGQQPDAFVRKYDVNGNDIWTRQFGTYNPDSARAISVDPNGNILVAGVTDGGTFPGQTSQSGVDGFVRKYSPDGNEIWTRQFGTPGFKEDELQAIAVDFDGNSYVVGYTDGTFPGQTCEGYDAFVRKYDPDGNEVWTRQFGVSITDWGYGVSVDKDGFIYVAGNTEGTFPGQTPAGGYDVFVRKYDPDGNGVWTRQFGTSGDDYVAGITCDTVGNLYVNGLEGWQGAAGTLFVRKFNLAGDEIWTKRFGNSTERFADGISLDQAGNIYVAGSQNGVFEGQTSAGGADAFVAKLSQDSTPPVLSGCSNIIAECASLSGSAVTFSVTATDAADLNPTVVCIPASESIFPQGETTVTCTATDENGNSDQCSFTVTIVDTTVPSITMPADIVAEATRPEGAAVEFTVGIVDLGDPNPTLNLSQPSGSVFALGTTVVTAMVWDASGNTNAGQFMVTVEDTTPPEITVPEDIMVAATGPEGAEVTFTASAVDLVDPNPTLTLSHVSGNVFALGETVVTATASDALGNTNSSQFTVTVVADTEPPALKVPSNIVAEATGPEGAAVEFTVSAIDLVDQDPMVSVIPASGSVFALGETVVTATASDASGNTNTSQFTVTVVDTMAPVVMVPSNIVAEATGPEGAVVEFMVSATDVVDPNPTLTPSQASGSVFALGETVVTATGFDVAGNTNTSQFTVTVVDTTAPAITGLSNIVAEATGPEGAVVEFMLSAADVVDPNPTLTPSQASGSVFALGETVVTVTATDAASNATTSSFTVTVADTTAPVITVPSNIVAEATGSEGASVEFSVSAADLADLNPMMSVSPATGSMFALGETVVTATASDAAGNTNISQFTVTVVDTTAPVITVPSNIVAEATGPEGAAVEFTVGVAELVDLAPALSVDPASGSVFALGETMVTATAFDASGNTNTSQFTVTVVDTTAPVITVPSNIVAEATGPEGAAVEYDVSAVVDLVDTNPVVSGDPASGSIFALGETVVTVTAADASGNTNTSQFTVTVVDTTAPAITVPSNIVAEATGPEGAAVEFTVSAIDLVGQDPMVSVIPASGSVFALGETVVTATASDTSGNTNTSQFTVTVVDTTAPAITVPSNIVVEATGPEGAAVAFDAPTAVDLVDPNPEVNVDPASGSVFAPGETMVTVTAADFLGNICTTQFMVTVVDPTPPTISGCENQQVLVWDNSGSAQVAYSVTVTDLDPNPTVVYDPPSGSLLPLGDTIVTVTAWDASGNTNTCEFTVSVVADAEAPTISGCENISVPAEDPAGVEVTYAVTITDADPNPTVTYSPESGSFFPLGDTVVTVTAWDASGNTNNCEFTVTVVDGMAPRIGCPVEMIVSCAGEEGAAVTFDYSVADALDPNPAVTVTPESGSVFPASETTSVSIEAVDETGNSSGQGFPVTVVAGVDQCGCAEAGSPVVYSRWEPDMGIFAEGMSPTVSTGAWAVAGFYYDQNQGATRLFHWARQGEHAYEMQTVGPAFDGGANEIALAADGSTIVGQIWLDGSHNEAFRWTEGGGFQTLGLLPDCEWSQAVAVSADGTVVVGTAGNNQGQTEAYRWTEADGMQSLGLLPDGEWSQAVAVSADGTVVVGTAGNDQGQSEAFRWTETGGMQSLGVLTEGGWSQATAVSADGSFVVGVSDQDGNTTSFIWAEDTGMVPLPPVGEEQGFYYGYQVYPTAVSDDGSVVVALGENQESGPGLVWERGHGWLTLQQRFEYLGMSPSMDFSYLRAISVEGRNITGIAGQNGAPQVFAIENLPLPPDLEAPRIGCPMEMIVGCAGEEGEAVTFDYSVTDDLDPSPAVTVTPEPGSIFPAGENISVSIEAVDETGNSSGQGFSVTVVAGVDQCGCAEAGSPVVYTHWEPDMGNFWDGMISAISTGAWTTAGFYYDQNQGATRLFRWTRQGSQAYEIQTVGPAFEGGQSDIALSADGSTIVGQTWLDGSHGEAFRWSEDGGFQTLGLLPDGEWSQATAVSTDGAVVVGTAGNDQGQQEAFRWTEADGMQSLGLLPDGEWSQASAISADGSVVVGSADNGQGQQEAFRWTASGGMQKLGILPEGGWSQATTVSADGAVVAGVSDQEGNTISFIWTEGTGMELLPKVGEDEGFYYGYSVYPQAVSDDGSMVVAVGENEDSGPGLVWERGHGWLTLQQRFEYLGMSPSMDFSYLRAIRIEGRNITGFTSQGTGVFTLENLPLPPDLEAPRIGCPAEIIVGCAGEEGEMVEFDYSVTDALDPNPAVTVAPESGSVFPAGEPSNVSIEAVDASGNQNNSGFSVTVVPQGGCSGCPGAGGPVVYSSWMPDYGNLQDIQITTVSTGAWAGAGWAYDWRESETRLVYWARQATRCRV